MIMDVLPKRSCRYSVYSCLITDFSDFWLLPFHILLFKLRVYLWLLVDPVVLGRLPGVDLLWLEPKSDLLLCTVNGVGAVADVAADIDGKITTDGTWGGGSWVGGTEEDTAGLDGVTTFPDHSADWARGHVCGCVRV